MISKEGKESLDLIRKKVEGKHYDFDKKELIHLQIATDSVNDAFKLKRKVLDLGCSSCVITAVNQLFNYVTYHEEKEVVKETKTTKNGKK